MHAIYSLIIAVCIMATPCFAEDTQGTKKHEDGKPIAPQVAPQNPESLHRKSGELFHDKIVEFETAYGEGFKVFEVDEFTRHDYDTCLKVATALADSSERLKGIHEDRLRHLGQAFHNNLELLELNAHRLRGAILEHNRTEIGRYWYQLRLIREELAQNGVWK